MAIDRLPRFVIELSLMMTCLKQACACANSPLLSSGSFTSSPPGGGDLLAAAAMMDVEYGLGPQYFLRWWQPPGGGDDVVGALVCTSLRGSCSASDRCLSSLIGIVLRCFLLLGFQQALARQSGPGGSACVACKSGPLYKDQPGG